MNLKSITQQVSALSKETGKFIREESTRFKREDINLKSSNNLVTYVDTTAEKRLIKGLLEILPESGILAEEETGNIEGKEYQWIIDPLDGTTNYVHGIPAYAISIALYSRDELLIGVVYEINRDECFYAWKDGDAWLNGESIKVTSSIDLTDCLIATGFPYDNFEQTDQYLELLKALMQKTRGIRRIGSAAVDLAYTACGRFDAFYEYNLNAWDVAGGALIVKEAGGSVTDFSGNSDFIFGKEIVAAAPGISTDFLSLVQKKMHSA